jgi:N-[(2S)-2-amino-2-carboxyethyl]-L-glutamate dehydrogenase
MKPGFHVVSGKVVHDLLWRDVGGCFDAVRAAYLAHHEKRTINPPSFFLRFPERAGCRIIGLPASIGASVNTSGIKWIASYPENVREGLPRASAVLILNRTDNGYPYACLESSIISAARTAASAVLAARVLARSPGRIGRLGIVGAGFIARYVYRFLLHDRWDIGAVSLFDTNPRESERFCNSVLERDRHGDVCIESAADDLLRRSDLILFATTAGTPYVHAPFFEHAPVVLHLSLRDLAPELIVQAQNVVDDLDHVMNAGTSLHLAQQATGGRAFVSATLAEVITGERTLDRRRESVFSPFGLGVLDLAVGKWIYEMAVREGATVALDDFFFDLQR